MPLVPEAGCQSLRLQRGARHLLASSCTQLAGGWQGVRGDAEVRPALPQLALAL